MGNKRKATAIISDDSSGEQQVGSSVCGWILDLFSRNLDQTTRRKGHSRRRPKSYAIVYSDDDDDREDALLDKDAGVQTGKKARRGRRSPNHSSRKQKE
jgi:hypothetical protein